MRYGSLSVETSYQPSGLPVSAAIAARVGDQAVDQRDVGAVQLALADEGDLDVLRHEDLAPRCPRQPRTPPSRWPALPADGIDERRRAEMRGLRHRRRQAARLEGVGGIERLVLDEEPIEAERVAEPRRVDQRRPPFAERDRRLAVEQRHQLAIAPHVRLASGERLRLPCARGRRVVAGEQRHAADDTGDARRGRQTAAPHGTQHSRWVK